jgi:hypothetical protein
MLKKAMNSEGMIVVGGKDFKDKFPVGFSYVIGGTVYTVKKIITKDANSEMRRILTSSGDVEDVEISTIIKDLKEAGCKVLSEGEVKKEAEKEVKKKKK